LGFGYSFSFGAVTSWVCAAAPKAERRSDGRTAEQKKDADRHQNSSLIAATNGQMAGSIAGRAVAADRKLSDCRVLSVRRREAPDKQRPRIRPAEALAIEMPRVAARQK
jgi:hypothetical protein